LLSYKINKHDIIENFCVDKEETTFKCAEKCHLKTELTKAENEDERPIDSASETNHITWFTLSIKKLESKSQMVQENHIALTPLFIKQEYTRSIFHSPKV
jgi:hypothetical protein